MACCICNNAYGMCFCKNDCSYIICLDCLNKLDCKECPQCRIPLMINMFFAGKISERYLCSKRRRFVLKDDDFEDEYDALISKKCGNMDIAKQDCLHYNDYINTETELPTQKIGLVTNITGPFVILDSVRNCFDHGCFMNHTRLKSIAEIINKRNQQMIQKCDVFSLKINNNVDCYRSIAEWGIASNLGKILIIESSFLFPCSTDENDREEMSNASNPNIKEEVDINNYIKNKMKEFYLFAIESIESLEKLSFPRREAIFTSHPNLDITYKQYKHKLEELISWKRLDHEISLDDDSS